jgi:hypothetical protein
MKNSRLILFRMLLLVFGVFAAHARAQASASDPSQTPRKAAVFVFSREPKVGRQQVKILEDLIAARVSSQGFSTLTRDVVLDSVGRAMKQPTIEGLTKKDQAKTAEFYSQITDALHQPDNVNKSLEDQLDEQSSVMRLAQAIGADLLVIAVVESYGTDQRDFKGNDLAPVATTTTFNNLLVSYRLAFAASGAAVTGDTVRVSRAWRESQSLHRETDDLMNGMFDEAAGELAKKIAAANHEIKEVPKVQAVSIVFNVKPVLPGGTLLQLPSYWSNNVAMSVDATVAADVSLDGVSIGSIPGDIHMATGLHQLTVQAEGFKTWKRFVNVTEGQKFDIQLQMTPEGYEKWKEVIAFLSDLSRETKLSDVEVKQMEAKADAMRKAGIIVTINPNSTNIIKKESP